MRDRTVIALFALFAIAACIAEGGETLAAQRATLPPIRPLGAIEATVADSFKNIQRVLELSDGRVVVRDESQDRLVVLNRELRHGTPILDNSGTTVRRYGTSLDGPYVFHGDSMLVLDAAADALLVVAPSGTLGRVFAPPIEDLLNDSPAGDGRGGLVVEHSSIRPLTASDSALGAGGRAIPDSTALARVDLATRRVDTLTYLRDASRFLGTRGLDSCGADFFRPRLNPLPERDAWVVLSDGTIAVVRGRDLHVDWIGADGSVQPSRPLPHEWHRLLDTNKLALVDSLRRGIKSAAFGMTVGHDGPIAPACLAVARAVRAPDYPTPDNLPDYAPPLPEFGGVFADADDNLWIELPDKTSTGDGPVFLIVDRRGDVIDRVQIPGGTAIAGFGRGVVFLQSRVGRVVHLVRARFR